nr:SDR family oxidoreductase [Streptomyces sp. WAC04770]
MARHLVTGATGLVGGLLVLELLERDADAEVLCLTRPRATLSAQERLLTALRDAAQVYGRPTALRHVDRRCTAVPGDLAQVTDSAVTGRLGAVDHVWHSAASLAFEDEARDDIMRINVEGTRNLADLAQRLHVLTFNHISTAYVAGQRVGEIPATTVDPDRVRSNNLYEHSKVLGEQIVTGSEFATLRILRPSVVVGHSSTLGATSFSGLYGVVRILLALRARDPQGFSQPLRIRANPHALLNLVPVDIVVRACVDIHDAHAPSGVYHLANTIQAGTQDTLNAITDRIAMPRLSLVDSADGFSEAEQRLDNAFTFYRPYLNATRNFDLTSTMRHSTSRLAVPLPPERLTDYIDWYLSTLRR